MASDASPSLWIGTPQRGRTLEDVLDPYTSRIGGKAACFRVGSTASERLDAAALSKYFQCPQCKSAAQVSLVSQIYAPVAVYDRVLYVLTCAACTRKPAAGPSGSAPASGSAIPSGGGKKSSLAAAAATKSLTSFCFAVRSQNFSRDYFAELQEEEQRKAAQQSAAAQSDKAEGEAPLFGDADDDWGDDDDAQAPVFGASAPAPPKTDGATASTAAEAEAAAVPEEQTSYPLAEHGATAAVKGQLYTEGLPLDLYVVPPRAKPKELSIEEQLAVAERMYGDSAAVDTSGFEEDDETPAEACVREYMEAMEATPSQCVRWCLGGAPLRTSLLAVGASGGATPPPCPACGAPRQFEMQLTAPTVYFLTKDIGEAKNATLHFSNVLVYTCSKHCYGGASSSPPYLPEYVVVEDEL